MMDKTNKNTIFVNKDSCLKIIYFMFYVAHRLCDVIYCGIQMQTNANIMYSARRAQMTSGYYDYCRRCIWPNVGWTKCK